MFSLHRVHSDSGRRCHRSRVPAREGLDLGARTKSELNRPGLSFNAALIELVSTSRCCTFVARRAGVSDLDVKSRKIQIVGFECSSTMLVSTVVLAHIFKQLPGLLARVVVRPRRAGAFRGAGAYIHLCVIMRVSHAFMCTCMHACTPCLSPCCEYNRLCVRMNSMQYFHLNEYDDVDQIQYTP